MSDNGQMLLLTFEKKSKGLLSHLPFFSNVQHHTELESNIQVVETQASKSQNAVQLYKTVTVSSNSNLAWLVCTEGRHGSIDSGICMKVQSFEAAKMLLQCCL